MPAPFTPGTRRASAVLVLALALGTPHISAQAPSAEVFDQIGLLARAGDRLTVTRTDGTKVRGTLIGLTSTTVTLGVRGTPVRLDQDQVGRISHRRDDSLANGAAWGLGVGAAAGFAACGSCHVGPGLVMAGFAGGIGAGIGVGIDALIRANVTLYQRNDGGPRVSVAPILAPSHKAVAVTVGF